ncbi:2-dehydro-3-deoxygalactonokinase [Tetragenococcus halophilus]|uniref:2-dehydro-3-deoxygalactonokinase n=1 Tax=Tetragenococcus halophilus TaxID=51669 RepID=UPI00102FA4DE|nr:2-dehydro-3-deoxygalactonokinase [Tetragenococcus halophilus]MCO7026388.1 2-dehydro-3-deoxygalactonokinase [Tetragenococcus halophilus]
MKSIITIDTGTTNTRAVLWQDGEKVEKDFEPVGVRDTSITGDKKRLKEAVKKSIEVVLKDSDVIDHSEVTVIASGMITSDLGLEEVPHLEAPVGAFELAYGMVRKSIPEVFDQPIWFIPGVKNTDKNIWPGSITNMDIMRGEEVEVIGAISQLGMSGPAVLILPGSHTKIVKLDRKNCISGSITTMTGELMEFLTKKSILADSLDESFTDFLDEDALKLGAKTYTSNGITRTAFSVRLLDMYTDYSRNQRANYLLGSILENDIMAIRNTEVFSIGSKDPFIILGNQILSQAFKVLIENNKFIQGRVITREIPDLAGLGVIEIAKLRKVEEDKRNET